MNKKQTAVEWFEQQLDNLDIEIPQRIFEEAKEMFKEQIEDAFQAGKWDWPEHLTIGTELKDSAQYYNEIYRKEANYE